MENSQSEFDKLNSAKWSAEYFTLSQLLGKYCLPQIVKITEGFYGESDDLTLCNGTILYLESVKSIQKVHGRFGDGKAREMSISLDCERKVEVRPSNLKDVYENVEELCSMYPKYVRISQGYLCETTGEILVDFGDKLQFQKVNKGRVNNEIYIFSNQHGQQVELTKSCVAGYQPLVDGMEYKLTDALRKFGLPLKVQFLESSSPSIVEDGWSCNDPPCKLFEVILLERVSNETVIKATVIQSNGKHDAMINLDSDIGFVICEDYTSISQIRGQRGNKQSEDIYEDTTSVDVTSLAQQPKTRNSQAYSDSSANHRKIGLNEDDYSEPENPSNNPTYTTLDPTYVSKQVYQKLDVDKLTASSLENQQPPLVQNLLEDTNALSINKPSKYPDFTSLDPTDSSIDQKYEMPAAAQDSQSSANQQEERDEKQQHALKKEIGLPAELKNTSKNKRPPLPITPKRTEVANRDSPPKASNNKPDPQPSLQNCDRSVAIQGSTVAPEQNTDCEPKITGQSGTPEGKDVLLKPECLTTPSETQPHDTHAIPKYPTSIPHSHPKTHESHQSAAAKYPLDLSSLTVADVGRLLEHLGMEKHVEIFANELIDGSMLSNMDGENFQSLDMSQFHSKKLLRFIEGWRPKL